MKLDKDQFETMCRNAGMKPELRKPLRELEVYIADGFSMMPHNTWRRFGVEADEFPSGMYVTLWMLSKREGIMGAGRPIFFDAFHNPELEGESKKQARINAALDDADQHLQDRKKRKH